MGALRRSHFWEIMMLSKDYEAWRELGIKTDADKRRFAYNLAKTLKRVQHIQGQKRKQTR